MAAERIAVAIVAITAFACGGAAIRRTSAGTREEPALHPRGCERAYWPVRPCAGVAHADRVGVWMTDRQTFAYDGCHVSYIAGGPSHESWQMYLCRPGHGWLVLYEQYGDPSPFYRARARWDGDVLMAESSLSSIAIARWDDGAFVVQQLVATGYNEGHHEHVRMRRAERLEEVRVPDLLCARRIEPSHDELVREHGPECEWPP